MYVSWNIVGEGDIISESQLSRRMSRDNDDRSI